MWGDFIMEDIKGDYYVTFNSIIPYSFIITMSMNILKFSQFRNGNYPS